MATFTLFRKNFKNERDMVGNEFICTRDVPLELQEVIFGAFRPQMQFVYKFPKRTAEFSTIEKQSARPATSDNPISPARNFSFVSLYDVYLYGSPEELQRGRE